MAILAYNPPQGYTDRLAVHIQDMELQVIFTLLFIFFYISNIFYNKHVLLLLPKSSYFHLKILPKVFNALQNDHDITLSEKT